MVSTRYLLEVAELSCLKSIPTAWVTSVNCTSGEGAAPPSSRSAPQGRIRGAVRNQLRMSLPEPAPVHDSLRLLDDEEVIGRQVPKRLPEPGGPGDLDGIRGGGVAQAEVQAEIALRVVARAAHDLAYLAVVPAGDRHPGADRRPVRARAHALDQDRMVAVAAVVAQQGRGPSRLFTITSTSPSLSKSPKAHPRPRFSARMAAPAFAETSSKRPFPRLR